MEAIGDYLKKGVKIGIEGPFEMNHFEDKEGNKRSTWEFKRSTIFLLGGKNEENKDVPF